MRLEIESVENGFLVTYRPTQIGVVQPSANKTIFADADSMLEWITKRVAPPEPWPEGAKWKAMQVGAEGVMSVTFLDSDGCCLKCGQNPIGYDAHKCKAEEIGE